MTYPPPALRRFVQHRTIKRSRRPQRHASQIVATDHDCLLGRHARDRSRAARRRGPRRGGARPSRAGASKRRLRGGDPRRAPAGVDVDLAGGAFDFDARLRTLVRERRIERPFYVGGGSIPLLDASELGALADRLANAERTVISNNFFSADFVAWTPGAAIEALPAIPSDNRLPQLLHADAGLDHWAMERTAASQFDIDTPTDLAVLKAACAGGPHLRRYLDGVDLDLAPFERAMRHFLLPSTIVVAGRVGSFTWQYLERETACRVRIFSEERGMQADGRETSGQVRSLLGFYLERVGADGLFAALAALGEAVFLDSRVLFAHARRPPARAGRRCMTRSCAS
jgi:hypothetical protein